MFCQRKNILFFCQFQGDFVEKKRKDGLRVLRIRAEQAEIGEKYYLELRSTEVDGMSKVRILKTTIHFEIMNNSVRFPQQLQKRFFSDPPA